MEAEESTILIVDDDAEDLNLVERTLGPLGCKLVAIKDPHKVMDQVLTHRPKVVIMDALLPGLSGFDLCKQIKTNAELKGTQVLVLTGVYLRKNYQHEARQQFKADHFMHKPFRPPELQRVVVQLLSKSTKRPPSSFLRRLGLPAPAARPEKPEKEGFFGRLFGKKKAPPSPAPGSILGVGALAPTARKVSGPVPKPVPEARTEGAAELESPPPSLTTTEAIPAGPGESLPQEAGQPKAEAPPDVVEAPSSPEVARETGEKPAEAPSTTADTETETSATTVEDGTTEAASETTEEKEAAADAPSPAASPEAEEPEPAEPEAVEELNEEVNAAKQLFEDRFKMESQVRVDAPDEEAARLRQPEKPQEAGEATRESAEVKTPDAPRGAPVEPAVPAVPAVKDEPGLVTAEDESEETPAEPSTPDESFEAAELVSGKTLPFISREQLRKVVETSAPAAGASVAAELEQASSNAEAGLDWEAASDESSSEKSASSDEPAKDTVAGASGAAVAETASPPDASPDTAEATDKEEAVAKAPPVTKAPDADSAGAPVYEIRSTAVSDPVESEAAVAAPEPPPTAGPDKAPKSLFRNREVPLYEEDDFFAELKRELNMCRRVERPLTLILIQIVDLRQIVEMFGANFEEPVLWHVAEQAVSSLREVDLVGMMGSEHLIAMSAFASDRYGGGRVVARVRRALKKQPFTIGEELPPIIPKLRFGMATFPRDGEDLTDLMNKAREEMAETSSKA